MEPSPDNLAVQCLASDIQVRNVRKVHINANVTFIIWILEWLANINCSIIAWLFAQDIQFFRFFGHTSVFLLFALIWYYVILPYTYLMNTSHNKKRIIDDGLVSVLRNLIRPPVDFNTIRKSICNRLYLNFQNLTSRTRIVQVPKIVESETSSKLTDKPCQKNTLGVYVISNSAASSFVKDNIPNVPLECASTSKGITYIEEGIKRNILSRKYSSDSSLVNEKGAFLEESRISVGKKILSYMTENVSMEEVYLHFLVQLVDFEEKVNDQDASLLQFEIIPHISDELKDVKKSTKTKRKGRHRPFLAEDKSKFFNKTEAVASSKSIQKKNLIGSLSRRMEMRREMLEDFSAHCNNEESYETYVAKVIDFEEGMIEY